MEEVKKGLFKREVGKVELRDYGISNIIIKSLLENGYGVLTGYNIKHGDSKERLMDADVSSIEGITIKELN